MSFDSNGNCVYERRYGVDCLSAVRGDTKYWQQWNGLSTVICSAEWPDASMLNIERAEVEL